VEEDPGGHVLSRLARTVAARAITKPSSSYTVQLLASGVSKISQKVGEEAVEVVVAANSEDDERLASEAADLLYHLLVLLQARGIPLDVVLGELESRAK
jgi:phosphoribosyl-ATP pyrophosphohydrolase